MKITRIQHKPKVVEYVDVGGKLPVLNGIDTSLFEENIANIVRWIESGTGIPEEYYRESQGIDYLLMDHGWMHLHIGYGIDDNALLIVEQTEDKVIFIAITDHSIFDERPRGKSLINKFGNKVKHLKQNPIPTPQPTNPQTTPAPSQLRSKTLTLKKPTKEN